MKTIKFRHFKLDDRLLCVLDEIGFAECTPVQAECLPLILEGHDVAGQAQTGTGKTAAFLLSTINFLLTKKIDNNRNLRAIIIAPTRELAIQIHRDAEILNRYCDLKIGLVYGGVDYEKQQKKRDNVKIRKIENED